MTTRGDSAAHRPIRCGPRQASIPWDSPETRTRLRGQKLRILGRLQAGRMTNADLARIALKYTGRISELREMGHDIRVVEKNASGLTVYALFVEGREV